MSHANARLTVHGRRLIVDRWRSGWRQAHIAAAMGVSRKCVKTWIDRFRTEGETGLRDRSSRPHRIANRTPSHVEAAVVAVREAQRTGRDWIAAELGIPPRTVSRILARHGLPHLALLDPMTGQRIRASRRTSVRYERARPGELVHMDVKKLGRIPDGGGWRAHGRSEDVRGRGIGYDYVHSLVDDRSRLAYSEIQPDEKGTTCARFFQRAVIHFTEHGITRIEQVMTDNHLSYKRSTAVREAIVDIGAKHVFIKPHCPWQNGKVERLNRTLLTEWAYRQAYSSNAERTAALAPWLDYYNTRRRHQALAGHPPISRLQPTC